MNRTEETPAWLDVDEYPFTSRYFELPAGRMHYVDEGEGKPIVFLHGNPGWSFEFRNVVKAMSKTHRCIAPDLIGFGFSDKPQSWDYLPESHAENIGKFLGHLRLERFTLVVNDWGGPIGLSYAIQNPQTIERLVLLNSWMWPVDQDWHYRAFSGLLGGAVGRMLIRKFNFFGKVIVRKAVGDASKLSSHIHRHYYRHLGDRTQRKGCYTFPKAIIGSTEWLRTLWLRRETIRHVPTTIIWGMKDIAFREKELKVWLTHWTEARVIRLKEVGHFPQEEAPWVLVGELSLAND